MLRHAHSPSELSSAIPLGRLIDIENRRIEARLLYNGKRNVIILGPNGSGKAVRLLVQTLLQSTALTTVVTDPKAELAAITAPFRRTLGPVVVCNPFGMLTDYEGYEDLKSDGFNPLIGLNPGDPSFNVKAGLLAEAMMPMSGKESQPYFDESARSLGSLCIMQAVLEAFRLRRWPSMARVRELICMPSEGGHPGNGYKPEGIPKMALEWAASPIMGMRNKAGQFTNWTRDVQGVANTAMRHTEFLDDPEIASDMERGRFDFSEIKKRVCTIYAILPPEQLQRHAKWIRLVNTAAMQPSLRPREPGEPRVLFMIDEFAAVARGGFPIIDENWALVRGYGVQIVPVLQDLNQLRRLRGDDFETFIGNAGAMASFPPNDPTTAKWLSERAGETEDIVMTSGLSESTGTNPPGQSGGPNVGVTTNKTFQKMKVPLLPPHMLYGMEEGFMLVTLAGLSNVVPTFAPPYWNIRECADRARANPYYHPAPRRRRS